MTTENPEKEYKRVLELLQEKYGWDWTTMPDEKKLSAELINDTIKAVKHLSNSTNENYDFVVVINEKRYPISKPVWNLILSISKERDELKGVKQN